MITKLVIKQFKNRKVTTFLMFLSLFVSMFFMTFTTLYQDNTQLLKQKQNLQMYGKWQGAYYEKMEETHFQQVGIMNLITEIDENLTIGSFDEEMFQLAYIQLLEGRYPSNEKEVMMEHQVLDALKKPYELNQTLSFEINGITQEYTLVGILPAYSANWVQQDSFPYPNIITTQSKGTPIYFVYDKNITRDNAFQNHFNLINMYSYPELDINTPVIKQINLLQLFDILVLAAGFIAAGTVFYQTLLSRKKQIYALCMMGIKESTLHMQACISALLLSVIAIPLGMILAMFISLLLFMMTNKHFILSEFHIAFSDILLKALLLLTLTVILFLVLNKIMIYSWYKSIKSIKKTNIKHKNKFVRFSFIACLIIFSILNAFLLDELFAHYSELTRLQYEKEITGDYVCQNLPHEIDIMLYQEGQDIYRDGKMKHEIEDIPSIYGIESLTYGYEVTRLVSDIDYSFDYHTLKFKSISYTRKQMEEIGLVFNDTEYERFMAGDSVFMIWVDTQVHDPLNHPDWINDILDKGFSKVPVHQTFYMFHDSKSIPVVVDSVKIISQYRDGNIYSKLIGGDILCSEAFFEKHFGLKDGPYQHISANVNASANYEITDKQMAQKGFENLRLQLATQIQQTKTNFYLTAFQFLIVVVLMSALLFNLYGSYINAHQNEIDTMKMIGVKDAYIYKKYGVKIMVEIIICFFIGFMIYAGICIFNNYMIELARYEEAKLIYSNATFEYSFMRSLIFHTIRNSFSYMIQCIIMMIQFFIVSYLLRKAVHKDMMDSIR